MARFAVIGAGIIGVCTAYELARAGHHVTLIDRHEGPCEGTSARNGAQLSYAYSDALGSPALLAHFPEILLGRDPAYRVRMQADPEFLLWGLRFLLAARQHRFLDNTRYLLDLAAQSRDAMAQLLRNHDLRFDYAAAGKMILYSTPEGLAGAQPGFRLKSDLGFAQQILTRQQATAIEPALDAYGDPIAGVIFSPDDAVGQPHLFCRGLIGVMESQYGAEMRFGLGVDRIEAVSNRETMLHLSDGQVLPMAGVVICTGQTSGLAARFAGMGASWPVQGYSMTVPALPGAMQVSITDVKRKTVFARIGDDIRIAGIADIGRRHPVFAPDRFETLRQSASEAFAGCYDVGPDAPLQAWTGARPVTPSSRPIIRRQGQSGLYLNLAHGGLGWTLALGSAARLAALVAEDFACA